MRRALLGFSAALVIGGSVAALSQHAPAVHSGQHASSPHAAMMQSCDSPEHVSLMADKLDLTTEQRSTVDRVTTEACAAMARYHEQILGVLTPEQREKLKTLHTHDESGLHAIITKLHGGR
jgi:Spy/CpxP family protein refolding chaperone